MKRRQTVGSDRRRAASRRTPPAQTGTTPRSARGHKLNARPDTLDFRDRMYEPTLVEVPTRVDLAAYRRLEVPILDQGREGACTGFGLAAVANALLRRRAVVPDRTPVSPRMLYEMAKKYDEWPGEDYDGSSGRGAMKGWHKHGVCAARCWEYDEGKQRPRLYENRWADASRRPLGAYFRVDHTDLVALHSAIAEAGVLYATSSVHAGWDQVGRDGRIVPSTTVTGGHAFAIVAYDERGFWVQNSWGAEWGFHGFGHLTYDDWFDKATDTWVARLGAPVVLSQARATSSASTAAKGAQRYVDLRPHIISLGNDGQPRADGTYGTTAADIANLFEVDFPTITAGWNREFGKRRLLIYAHGGLVSEDEAIQLVADDREALLRSGIYPVSFIWKTDYLSTLKNVLEDALRRRRPEGVLDRAKDFMLDRLDDALEPLARVASGFAEWSEMKENAVLATKSPTGGARLAADRVAALLRADPTLDVHLVAHSAGSILLGPFAQLLTTAGVIASEPLSGVRGLGRTVASCTLWAPACTTAFFEATYAPVMAAGGLRRVSLFTLTDKAERDDDCANIYHRSLLYLVSNAFEATPRIPLLRDGVPLLGMERCLQQDPALVARLGTNWIKGPNTEPVGSPDGCGARHHGDFHGDPATLQATLARILAGDESASARARTETGRRHASASALVARRQGLDIASRR